MAYGSINTSLGILPGSAADTLTNQVTDETEEERKKRLRLAGLGTVTGPGSALNSLAATNLFGGSGAYGR